MLNICAETLPQSQICYLAFRVAFEETLERIVLARQMEEETHFGFGFLTEVPFLAVVPPHVQLDLLAETWRKHMAVEPFDANLVDESIVYAACETSAGIAEEQPDEFHRFLEDGPQTPVDLDGLLLAAELRSLHLNLANEGDFLLISQFEDIPPDEARPAKEKFNLGESRLEPMFDVLARWHVSPNFLPNLGGLFSTQEIVQVAMVLGVK